MKILFIHLSDAHIENLRSFPQYKCEALVNVLPQDNKVSRCVIVFSGDLTGSGAITEYKCVSTILGSIISKLKSKYTLIEHVDTLMVPGNHDRTLPKKEFENISFENFQDYLPKEQKNFYNFLYLSRFNRCFTDNFIYHKKPLNYDGFIIEANLINTAIFSKLHDKKSCHYFPTDYMPEILKPNKADLVITIMHHPASWFDWTSEMGFANTLYKKNAILFVGHEHAPDNNSFDKGTVVCKGGCLANRASTDSSFNSILIDTDTFRHSTKEYRYTSKSHIYEEESTKEGNIKQSYYKLFPSDEYKRKLFYFSKIKISDNIDDYFVFPTLATEIKNEKKKITKLDELISIINEQKYLIIEGDCDSGKTTLLKYLYLTFLRDKIPLFFSNDDIRDKKIQNIIRSAFEDQYGDERTLYEAFKQSSLDEKIAFIDDVHNVEDGRVLRDFLKHVSEEFGFVVITKMHQSITSVEEIKKTLIDKQNYNTFSIQAFYGSKRQQLITKLVKCISPNSNDNIGLVKDIEKEIKSQINFFQLDPQFITSFVNSYIIERKGIYTAKNIFSKIYETNIIQAIRNASCDDMVSPLLNVLGEIAYYIHNNKTYPLPLEQYLQIIDNYNSKYAVVDYEILDALEILRIFVKANIISTNLHKNLQFINNNYLAFFIASQINKILIEEKDSSPIQKLVHNICFGINGNIILYLAFISNNNSILDSICQAAHNLTLDWTELDLDSGNLLLFGGSIELAELGAPSEEDIGNNKTWQSESEEKYSEEGIIKTTNIYDFDESTVTSSRNQLLTALKCIEIISKILPSFAPSLVKQRKLAVLELLYSLPNKFIYQLIKPINDNIDELVKELTNDLLLNKQINITESKVKNTIIVLLLSIIASIYDLVAQLSADKNTIPLLDSYDYELKNTYGIQNLLMSLNANGVDAFIDKLKKFDSKKTLNSKSQYRVFDNLLKLIVWDVLLKDDEISRTQKEFLTNKYLPKPKIVNRQNLRLAQIKNNKK